jgi:EAL domain-containing protein (putative c-di-GMP-specific phosphodiesterase class I)/GGDEF domain-containing protein
MFFDMQDLNLQPGVAIFLVALFFVLACVLIVFLFFRTKKDRNRFKSLKFSISQLDKDSFNGMIKHKYHTADEHTHFTVILLQVCQSEEIVTSVGKKQYEQIIAELKERLTHVLPQDSKLSDYGDDRIIMYIDEDMDTTGITNLSLMCVNECTKPIDLLTKVKLSLNINLGIVSNDEFSPTANDFLQNIEIAISTAVHSGPNKFAIYSGQLAAKQTEEYKQYQDIKRAIENNEFTLFYQPIYNLEENKIIAYETLVRWKHPTLGILTPSKFLPIMEQTGDVNWIGVWAFEQMLRAQTNHIKNYPQDENIIFTFNLSPKQLMNPRLAEELRKVYKKYKIPASNICLEIVEFSVFDKVPEVKANIIILTQMGFKIAIDDFGFEMSSLKLIESLKVDWIKLDRKFIEKAQDDFLVSGVIETIVRFGERQNCQIVAEGIEDEIVLNYVKDLHITLGQGYYFGKPKAPEEYNI